MKAKNVLAIVFIILNYPLFSQTCLPEGITFNTQEEIDGFADAFPECTEILGHVSISSTLGSDKINNLNGLSQLEKIGDKLNIQYVGAALESLEGLNNLKLVGDNIFIAGNETITDLNGLNGLVEVGGSLRVIDNLNLENLSGLENLESVGLSVSIRNNSNLFSLNALSNLSSIENGIFIWNNALLDDLSGFENIKTLGASLSIKENSSLANINALSNLELIGENIDISFNAVLENLDSLKNLKSANGDELTIEGNPMLNDISGLENVKFENEKLSIFISANQFLSTCHIESICSVIFSTPGEFVFQFNKEGCNDREEVEVGCFTSSQDLSEQKIEIFPNPISDFIFIKKEKNENLDFQITDINGRIVLEGNLPNQINNIAFTKMNQGIYFIKIIDPRIQEFMVEKIIK